MNGAVFAAPDRPSQDDWKLARITEIQPIRRWRRTTRLVRMLCGVCIALRKYVIEAGLMTNYVMAVKRRKSQSGDESDHEIEEITFCLKNFQMKKELSVPLVLINAMEKMPEARTDQEILAISHLMRNLSSFRNYTQDMQLEMSRIVRYQKCEKGRVVLRKGHIGYSVYFVYSGSVSVVLDTEGEQMYVRKPKVVLKKGACFGEIALLRDTRRNATIVCAEECEFLVIDKDDFIESGIHLMVEEEFNNRFNFFRSWPPFEELSDGVIHQMTSISRTEYFNYNKVVISDSRHNENLWFVVKGSCDLLRILDLRVSPNYKRIKTLLASDPRQFLVSGFRDNGKTNGESSSTICSKETSIYVKLDTLRDGQSFGLDAFFAPDDTVDECRHSLVSKACTVIHISRKKLAEILDRDAVERMQAFVKSYPSDLELCDSFLSKSEWNNYKQGLINDVVSRLESLHGRKRPEADVKRNVVTSRPRSTRTKCGDVATKSSASTRSIIDQTRKTLNNPHPVTDKPKSAATESRGSAVGSHKARMQKLSEYTTQRLQPSSARPSETPTQKTVALVSRYTRPVSADSKIIGKSLRTKRPASHLS